MAMKNKTWEFFKKTKNMLYERTPQYGKSHHLDEQKSKASLVQVEFPNTECAYVHSHMPE